MGISWNSLSCAGKPVGPGSQFQMDFTASLYLVLSLFFLFFLFWGKKRLVMNQLKILISENCGTNSNQDKNALFLPCSTLPWLTHPL